MISSKIINLAAMYTYMFGIYANIKTIILIVISSVASFFFVL